MALMKESEASTLVIVVISSTTLQEMQLWSRKTGAYPPFPCPSAGTSSPPSSCFLPYLHRAANTPTHAPNVNPCTQCLSGNAEHAIVRSKVLHGTCHRKIHDWPIHAPPNDGSILGTRGGVVGSQCLLTQYYPSPSPVEMTNLLAFVFRG